VRSSRQMKDVENERDILEGRYADLADQVEMATLDKEVCPFRLFAHNPASVNLA
jgi:hypothetical protein